MSRNTICREDSIEVMTGYQVSLLKSCVQSHAVTLIVLNTRRGAEPYQLMSEQGTEKMPCRSTLKDLEPLLLNPHHSLVELLLCNHPFEKVSDELLALRCKRCSSLIDGIRLQHVPTPVTLLLPKSFTYDAMRFPSRHPLPREHFSYHLFHSIPIRSPHITPLLPTCTC